MIHLACNKASLVARVVVLMRSTAGRRVSRRVKQFVQEVFDKLCPTELPYHNHHHTYEVFEYTTILIKRLGERLSSDERMILMVAALCHDYGHEGKPNGSFTRPRSASILSSSSFSDLGSIDTSRSHNESFSVGVCVNILKRYHGDLFVKMSLYDALDKFTDLIMSTDLALHDKYFKMINQHSSNIAFMILVLKVADLSHFLRPFEIHLHWVYKIHVEQHGQILRTPTFMASDTIEFANRFVKPLLHLLGCSKCTADFTSNMNKWFEHL